ITPDLHGTDFMEINTKLNCSTVAILGHLYLFFSFFSNFQTSISWKPFDLQVPNLVCELIGQGDKRKLGQRSN
ncbi:hypothetical protein, partial [Acinetobacter baumannii]|uniref:hypothetical protein n=1 Tax=Acinetobacter baumannii TaxID=470 RepID=UPI001C07CA7C